MTDPSDQTGTGTPRSGAQAPSLPEQAADYDRGDEVIEDEEARKDSAISVGATTSSDPASGEDTAPNRSGSGGTGGPADGTEEG